MSIVVCKTLENGYEIASDSILTRGWTQSKGEDRKFSKLFEVNGLVIGSVGAAEEVGLFRIFATTRKPSSPNEAAFIEFISEFSEWKNKRTDERKIENSYLIGFEGKVFYIEEWFVEEIVKFEAIGAGMDFALAALHLDHSAKEAIEIAIELSIYCEGPVQVIKK